MSEQSINLGEHTVIIHADGTIELTDQQAVMQFSTEEVYKLLVTLQALFA